MLDSIFSTKVADSTITLPGLLLAVGAAFLLGLLISFVYWKTHRTGSPSQSFVITLSVLPVVVTVIILLVGSNVARAFSLAGAFSIIRFRSAPGDPKDITYVLVAMAIGLAAGMGFVVYAVVITALLCLILALLELLHYGQSRGGEKTLKITVPENLDYTSAFEGVLQKYTRSAKLQRVKTADLGSLYELLYAVVLKDGANEKEFIDELRCRNGNLTIALHLSAPSGEF